MRREEEVGHAVTVTQMRRKHQAAALAALLLLTLTLGCSWLGRWGYIAANEEILDSLPVAPGALRLTVSSTYCTAGDSIFSAPDGWSTLATHQAPPEASREDIVDFYLSELPAEWQSCVVSDTIDDPSTS